MKNLKVAQIEKSFSGYGHNIITVTVSGKLINDYGEIQDVNNYELKCTSNNTVATDAYFDEYYDDYLENENSFYETRYEAGESLVDEVFRKNQIESDYEITEVYSVEEVKELRDNLRNEIN